MKRYFAFALAVAVAVAAQAMVYVESHVLSVAEMQSLGLQLDVHTIPGPKSALCSRVVAFVLPNDPSRHFHWISFAVLEKALDADWASSDPKKTGARDSKTWAKEVRGETSAKPTLTFAVSGDEIPRSYLVVEFGLPPRDGIATFGCYYLPLRELASLSNH